LRHLRAIDICMRERESLFLLSEAGHMFPRPGQQGSQGRATEVPEAARRGMETDIIRNCVRHNSGF
jgi:hypothetical protein